MRYIITPLVGFLIMLLNLVAWIPALIVCLFIRWDTGSSMPQRAHADYPTPVVQGDLPWWLSWFQTPDMRFPGDLMIPEVKAVYDKYGRYWCSWYWIGLRNVLMGLACWCGRDASGHTPDMTDGYWEQKDTGVWHYVLSIGPFWLIIGHQVYEINRTWDANGQPVDGAFRSAPVFTMRARTSSVN